MLNKKMKKKLKALFSRSGEENTKCLSRKLINLSIKIGYIPVRLVGEAKSASGYSLSIFKSFIFLLLYFPLPFYLLAIGMFFYNESCIEFIKSFFNKNNKIDISTSLGFMLMVNISSPITNFLVASAFSSCPFSVEENFSCPKNIRGLLFSFSWFFVGSFIFVLGFSLGPAEDSLSLNVSWLLPTVLIPFLGLAVSFIHYFWSAFIVSCWLTKFIEKCDITECHIARVDRLLVNYAKIENSLGKYFAFSFTFFQFNWIFIFYLGVTALEVPYSVLTRILFGGGSFFTAFGGKMLRNID